MTENFASKLLSQGSIEQDNLSKNGKKIVLGEFNKNINNFKAIRFFNLSLSDGIT